MHITDVNNDGIAMDGLDPVSHYNGEPLLGNQDFTFVINDMKFHFSSKKNMEEFIKTPEKFIPINGGYTISSHVAPPSISTTEGQIVGNQTFTYHRNLEDKISSIENNIPINMKEDGNIEMQNLSDSAS